jgi:hypothetical protein
VVGPFPLASFLQGVSTRIARAEGTHSLPRCRSVPPNRKVGLRAPKEPRHVAWGASPRSGADPFPNSPEGATADRRSEKDRRRPFGAQGSFEIADLGLTPQATCRCPLQGKSRKPSEVPGTSIPANAPVSIAATRATGIDSLYN